MSRSVTVPIPGAARLSRIALSLLAVAVLIAVGVRVGLWIVSPGPAAELGGGGLSEIQTNGGTYVGRIVSDDGNYLRIAGPAIVRPESAEPNARLVVQLLSAEPVDVRGDILIPRSQVILVGAVAASSGLETAYRQATGELPPAATPTSSPAP